MKGKGKRHYFNLYMVTLLWDRIYIDRMIKKGYII